MAAKSNKKKIGSMEELLLSAKHRPHSLKRGEKIEAKLTEMGHGFAMFDIGGKSEGIINGEAFAEGRGFLKSLKIGDSVETTVLDPETKEGLALLSVRHAAQRVFWKAMQDAHQKGKPIRVRGKAAHDRGVTVSVDANYTAFVPASQLGEAYAGDSESLIGKVFDVKIIDLDRDKNRIVLSERAVSEAEKIKKIKDALSELEEGQRFRGKVTTLTSFGAFIEIEINKVKVEGLAHITELSWSKIDSPAELFDEGDEVDVVILGAEKDKLALSVKQAGEDPWVNIGKSYKPEDKVKGKVARVSDFGVFVELEPGVEGLIHITKIPPGTMLQKGQEVNVYVEEVNKEEHRISLGIVMTTAKPLGYK